MNMSTGLRKILFAFIVLFLGKWEDSTAGSYKITPVRIEISSENNPAVLELTNQDEGTAIVHIEAVRWTQRENWTEKKGGKKDIFQPTQDFLIVPPIVTISPQTTQTIRIMYKGPFPRDQKLPYRLLIQEIPNLSPKSHKKKGGGINIALNMSVPVYVLPQKGSEE